MRRTATLAVAMTIIGSLVTGCSLFGSDEPADHKVVLVTHDSFAVTDGLFEQFTKDTGITVDVRKSGDAGALANKLVLTKNEPIGDLAFGIDTTFASRPLDEGVFAEHQSPERDKGSQRFKVDDTGRLTAIDIGDVCVNYDIAALAAKGLPVPASFEDLADPKYRDLLVVEDPATSSPGLAFLLGTVAHYGEKNWAGYWQRLKANGVKVASSWEEAYTQDFSGSAGKGPRPLVVSYATSPAAETAEDGSPRTKAVLDTCVRQVEYAGVLKGARNEGDARKVLDFLLSETFQKQLPETMYVLPAREFVPLPQKWQEAITVPPNSQTLDPSTITANRERWISAWRSLVQG